MKAQIRFGMGILIMILMAAFASAYMISGQVVGSGVGPLNGTTVNLMTSTKTFLATTITNESGHYSFTGLSNGVYWLNASRSGWRIQTAQGGINNADTTVDFPMGPMPYVNVTGYVKNQTGLGLPSATVIAYIGGVNVGQATTDSSGYYLIRVWDNTTYSFIASLPGYNENRTFSNRYIQGNTPINFTLISNPGIGVLRGYVKTQGGSGIVGATVRLMVGTLVVASDDTDSNGHYYIEAPQNYYDAIASATGFNNAGTTYHFLLQNGITTDHNFTLTSLNTEICDGSDNDMDGLKDEGCDDDDDGYCDSGMVSVQSGSIAVTCPFTVASGYQYDCNDQNSNIHPLATETCNSADDDCDGSTDEGLTCGTNGGGGGTTGGGGGGGYVGKHYNLDMSTCHTVQKMHEEDSAFFTYKGVTYEFFAQSVNVVYTRANIDNKWANIPLGQSYKMNVDGDMKYDITITYSMMESSKVGIYIFDFNHLCKVPMNISNTTSRPRPQPIPDDDLAPISDVLPDDDDGNSGNQTVYIPDTGDHDDDYVEPENPMNKPFNAVTGRVVSNLKMLKANWIIGILIAIAIIILGLLTYWLVDYYRYY